MSATRRCDLCDYWNPGLLMIGDDGEPALPKCFASPGDCRRHPPTMSGWPKTYEHGWCGEFLRSEETI